MVLSFKGSFTASVSVGGPSDTGYKGKVEVLDEVEAIGYQSGWK